MERLIFGEYEITEDLVAPFLQVFQMKDHTGIIADAVGGGIRTNNGKGSGKSGR